MQATDTFMDHEIRVDATRNANGAWVAQVRIFRDGAPVDLPAPAVTPNGSRATKPCAAASTGPSDHQDTRPLAATGSSARIARRFHASKSRSPIRISRSRWVRVLKSTGNSICQRSIVTGNAAR